jgi:hypothetical protein
MRRGLKKARRFFSDHLAIPIGVTTVGGAALLVVLIAAPSRVDPASGDSEIYGWGGPALLLALLVTAAGVVTLVLGLQHRQSDTRAERVQRLSTALREAMQIIREITGEMEEGRQRLDELERQTDLQRELANLTVPEATAVREALQAELGRERRRSLWRDVMMVILGAGLSYLLARFLGYS